MAWKRLFEDPFLHKRHLHYVKSRTQARFRNEEWKLTEAEWNEIWNEERFSRIGRGVDDVCLTRIDPLFPWRRDNVVVISRRIHLKIKNRKYWNLPYEHYYKEAEWIA